MHQFAPLLWIAALLGAGIVGATLSRRIGLPTVVGYFAAGAAVGPHGLALVPEGRGLELLAELGVVFLLFDIGLHFSLKSLWETRRQLFGLGPLQVALCAVVLGTGAVFAGLPGQAALLVGATLALSSTAVVLRALMASGEHASPLGRTATAILIFQDLFAVVLLVLANSLGPAADALAATLGWVLLKAGIALAAVAIGGRLLRPIFQWVTRHGDDEAFTATALLLVLATAGAAGMTGLSMPLGAFLAGMVLSESEYCYRVKTDLKPFRGLLLGLFFITVGMSIEVGLLVTAFAPILAVVAALTLAKAAVSALAARLAGLAAGFAVRLGATLAQGSEFAFVVFALAAGRGALAPETAAILTAGVAVSMAVAAFAARAGDALGDRIEARRVASEAHLVQGAARGPHRVLLNGIGPVARSVARGLEAMQVDYLALEPDPARLAEGRAAGFRVAFGRADELGLVEAVGADRVQALVLGRVEGEDVLRFVEQLLARHPALRVLVRVRREDEADRLRATGAVVCVSPDDPDDQTLAAETLRALGIAEERISRWLAELVDDPRWEKADKAHAFAAA